MSLRYLPGRQSLTCAQRLTVHKALSYLSTWFPQKQTLRQDWTAGGLFRKWFPGSADKREKWDRKGKANVTYILEQITPVRNWGLMHWGSLEDSVEHTSESSLLGTRNCHLSFVEHSPWSSNSSSISGLFHSCWETVLRQTTTGACRRACLACASRWVQRKCCQEPIVSATPSIISFTSPWPPTRRYHNLQFVDEKTEARWG